VGARTSLGAAWLAAGCVSAPALFMATSYVSEAEFPIQTGNRSRNNQPPVLETLVQTMYFALVVREERKCR
jgi:hypothetical protein